MTDVVVTTLLQAERLVLCTHEHPDGDALGSLTAMQLALSQLGKDVVSFIAPTEFPLPYEYQFLNVDDLVTEVPSDERVAVFLDCGNIDRNPADALKDAATIVNIDHHHDNTCFGTVNLVVPNASSTAEIVWTLLEPLGVTLTHEIAEALYVGLVTDTGKFMYENTGPMAHRMAAALLEVGIDAQAIYRHLYEGIPEAKLDLLSRGLSNIERYDGGALSMAYLSKADYDASGAEEGYSEGVVDHLRALDGTAVAALVRDQLSAGREGMRKVSLRATDDRVDVSAIARVYGGGGHRRAAGFTTDAGMPELVEFLRREVAAQLSPV
ncbi:MAG: bifunctional oligoribonuclease and phosphatase NrnA [Solirubrobacteraceae bacterium]|jgi:phosphoesterase RecJ-like protein|nr:bifunctional oligoribonuclease and phosphatase NrnA [Solirubrobacteraceae bacterium]